MATGLKRGSAQHRKLSGDVTFREIYINNKLKPTAPQIHLCLQLMQSKALVVEKKKARRAGGQGGREWGNGIGKEMDFTYSKLSTDPVTTDPNALQPRGF